MNYFQWLYFLSATLEPQAWSIVLHSVLLPAKDRIPAIVPWTKGKFKQALSVVDEQLKDREYLLAEFHHAYTELALLVLLSSLTQGVIFCIFASSYWCYIATYH